MKYSSRSFRNSHGMFLSNEVLLLFAGWFPAKFVELLDERSKQYCCAGDDAVSEAVTDLVRGTLCPAIKQVFEHGMKRPNFLGERTPTHLHVCVHKSVSVVDPFFVHQEVPVIRCC